MNALKVVCLLLLSMHVSAAGMLAFDAFIQTRGRSYEHGSMEYHQRRDLYEKRMAAAEAQNSKPGKLWTAGVNRFWDWTEPEMQSLFGWDGGSRPEGGSSRTIHPHMTFLQQMAELPKEKIWSDLAMRRHVKDQGDCGSCWAIAAATVLEAHTEIHTGQVRTFSAQQIVSCTPNPKQCGGSGACGGATAELAMDFVMKHGCAEESTVPYTGTDGSCHIVEPSLAMAQLFSHSSPALKFGMTGWETLPKNTYEPLVRAIAELGPVAVSVDASSWFNYDSGIFDDCGKDAVINHAVTAIGYGEYNNTKFWTIQNSWGQHWGEDGVIRLLRHDKDQYCGMNNDPEKGVACKGDTAPVPVCGMCGVLFDSVVPHFKGK
eukprot:gnl/TRDRNA2_/TRDRNA2_171236_c0_seq6.p1 gnl/TRDRNA2_/TRDRNA2_171236_c0~~gnl/TRDRNA2_/TRDRNA2_171236_c0_seq6.p1  ORF type:complete len:374 (-),score=72.83 gnl/TRDRNA2_/TRDRNA2_171236_c0_seq6:110-1231(-)